MHYQLLHQCGLQEMQAWELCRYVLETVFLRETKGTYPKLTCKRWLQRLAEDSNPAIAAAAAKTIYELKRQWKIEEGDSWRFMMNQNSQLDDNEEGDDTSETDQESIFVDYLETIHN